MVVQGIELPDVWNEETKTGRWAYREVLGEGGFGVVHQALDMQNGGKPVAIKILRCGKDGYRHCLLGTKEVRQARLFQEKVYSKTKHHLFLQYLEDHTGLDVYTDEELRVFEQPDFDWESDERVKALRKNPNPYLVMELIKGRCVKSLTKERKLTFAEIRELMHQASAALWHLYKQQKIHRDFRVHNMMWHEGKLTIIDFGLVLSSEPQHADSKNRLVRTYWKLDSYWMPPEVKKPQLKAQQATFVPYNFAKNCPSSFDMYSFGVMALELLLDSGVNAKMARNQNAIEGKGQKRLRPLDAVKFTDETKLQAVGLSRHILNLCCARNPAHRPTPEMLLKGFQSEFPQGPAMSQTKEAFFRHLHQACGQQRADKGMKMLGYLAREIVLHVSNIEEYVDAMLIFTTEANVSIYRLLCIVDCACRSGGKWATAPNTMEIVIGSFAKVIKRMMEAARKLYSADTASNKFNRHKVIEFAKKWKEMKLFERPFGKTIVAPKAAPSKPERDTTNRIPQAPPTVTAVEDDVVAAMPGDKDHITSCQSVGSIGSWSSFTVSALTVKSNGPPDVDIVSSDSDDAVVEVASHTADEMSDTSASGEESSESESSSPRSVQKKGTGLAKAWWVDNSSDNERYTTRKKVTNLAKAWWVDNSSDKERYTRKKIVSSKVRRDDSSEEDSPPRKKVVNSKARRMDDSSDDDDDSPPRKKIVNSKARRIDDSSDDEDSPPRKKIVTSKARRMDDSSDDDSPPRKKLTARSNLPPPTRRRSPVKPAAAYRSRSRSRSRVRDRSRSRSRSRSSTRSSSSSRSLTPPPPPRRNKPRNCLAEESESDHRSPVRRNNVVLVARKNVSPARRSNTNGSLFPKFPELRNVDRDSPRRRRSGGRDWRAGPPPRHRR